MSRRTNSESNDNNCVVCCRAVSIYAIGECDHPVCHECSTRMRVLCRQNECPICRQDLQKVIFTRSCQRYTELADLVCTLSDKKYKVYFYDDFAQRAFYKLLDHTCKACHSRYSFRDFAALKDHLRREHELFFCDLCVEHLTIFTHERKFYTRVDLARHRRIGDPDNTSHRGHPICEFCDDRYLDIDELYRHLRREHFFCHFCDADGLHQYYRNYEELRVHFRKQHFPCEEGSCRDEKFTAVFRSDIDLKAHTVTTHHKNLTKAQAKQARTLELEFTITPRNLPNNGMVSAADYEEVDAHNRKGRRGNFRGRGHAHRERDDYGATGGYEEMYQQQFVTGPSKPSLNTKCTKEFPTLSDQDLNQQLLGGGYQASNSNHYSTYRQSSKFGADEFPALGGGGGGNSPL